MVNDSNYFQHVLGARFDMPALFHKYTSQLLETQKQALALRNMVMVHFRSSILYRSHERDLRHRNLVRQGGFWNPLVEDMSSLGPSDRVARSELSQLSRVKMILDSSMVQHDDLKKVAESRMWSLRWALKLFGIVAPRKDGASGGVEDMPSFRKLEQLEADSHMFLTKSPPHLLVASEVVFPRQLCACLRDRIAAAKEWKDSVLKAVPHIVRVSARKHQPTETTSASLSGNNKVSLWGPDAIINVTTTTPPLYNSLPTVDVIQELYQQGLTFRLSFEELSRLQEMIDEGQDAERRALVALHASLQHGLKKEHNPTHPNPNETTESTSWETTTA